MYYFTKTSTIYSHISSYDAVSSMSFITTCTLLNVICRNYIPNLCTIILQLTDETKEHLQSLFMSCYINNSTELIDTINIPSTLKCAFTSPADIKTTDDSIVTINTIKNIINSTVTVKINIPIIREIINSDESKTRIPIFQIETITIN